MVTKITLSSYLFFIVTILGKAGSTGETGDLIFVIECSN